jgi:splicing factor 3B subunit 4
MSSTRHYDQDKDSTLYVGNLDERCTDALVWELMLQAGPIVNVHLPKDRVTQTHQGYGFVEFASEEDADYASKIMNQIRLYGKPIRVNKASADKRGIGPGGEGASVGAELYVGGLDAMVDEKILYETFSRFGPLIAAPKVARDDANLSKNYGFISYASFDSSDEAIANMNGQYLMNREITVQYAYKKDGKGERHGDTAERALAAQAKKHGVQVQIPAMPAALVMPNSAPAAPASMNGAGK